MVIAVPTPNSKLSSNAVNNGKLRNNHFQTPKRPPLLPSEAENGPNGHPRRLKSKDVASRYLSSSTSSSSSTSTSTSTTTSSSSNSSNSMASRRCPSPMVARTVPETPMTWLSNSNRRSLSAERRRPVTPRAGSGEMSNATKLLMTSTRSLSVSFQGESFSVIPKSKVKPAPASSGLATVRKRTPERRRTTPLRDQGENLTSKPSDQQRWPARSRPGNSSFLTRSLDFGAAAEKARVIGSARAVKPMQTSLIDGNKRNITGTKSDSNLKNIEPEKKVDHVPGPISAISTVSETAASDTDSVSSGSNTSLQECGSVAQLRGGPRGIIVPARVWQETTNRLQRGSETGSPVLKNNGSKPPCASKLIGSKKHLNDVPVSSPRMVASGRGLSSPRRGGVRPSSPNKVFTSSTSTPVRGMSSPVRMRNGAASMLNNNVGNTPSILSFAADVRRGKMGENRILDAHELRLLHNRHLQWRFVNARTEASLTVQTEVAERSLYNAWVAASKLRHSVKSKRMELQLLRHNLKLCSVLNRQVPTLENWDIIERDHCNSLLGATEALEASTVRLPLIGGAKSDIQEVKNAICSAVDVMQTMASSICSLLTKVEQVNTLTSEVASMATNERGMLFECKDLVSKLTAMEIKDCSLRVHMLQLKRLPTLEL